MHASGTEGSQSGTEASSTEGSQVMAQHPHILITL